MNATFARDTMIGRIRDRKEPWDLLIVGGGATGVGVAMDAAARGLDTLLLERSDFGKGTSSRSTKLVHGGVRYLKQGNITLVRDALRERSLLRKNAPHLVHDATFLIPCPNTFRWLFYGIGLKLYDLLATGDNYGKSKLISGKTARELMPVIQHRQLAAGVTYHDGQFDDSRLLINMAQTAAENGGCLANYCEVTSLAKDHNGKVCGVVARDLESAQELQIAAKCVVNAGGPFCDDIREMDDARCESMVAASQGVHIVLKREFYPCDTAMIVPETSDGRVIFLIPWHDHVLIGTTDTAIPEAVLEPTAHEDEIQFLLDTTAEYLERSPGREDIQSVFVGIRPLVKGDKSARTASLSRDHVIRVPIPGS